MQSWLFWKNNRAGAVPVLMSISGLLNPVCIPLILAEHSLLQHILNASSVMLIYAIEWLCVPNTLSKPKSWPWPEAKLTWATFKATLDKDGFFFSGKSLSCYYYCSLAILWKASSSYIKNSWTVLYKVFFFTISQFLCYVLGSWE